MKIVAKERGMGKTEYLIQKSLETGYPIICCNSNAKIEIQRRNPNVKVYSVFEVDRRMIGNTNVLIDELDYILNILLELPVAEATFTGDISIDTIQNIPVAVSQEIKMKR